MSDVQKSQHEILRGLDIGEERLVADNGRGYNGVMAAKHDQSDTVGDGLGDTTHQQSYGAQAANNIEDNDDGNKSEPDVKSKNGEDSSQLNSEQEEEQKGEAPH